MKRRVARSADPHIAREESKYSQALPSREFILHALKETGVPISRDQLAQLLEIKDDELPLFERRLRAMERDGQIMRNRKDAICIVDKLDLIRGRVEGHAEGFGFVIPDDGGPDLFLNAREMNKVLHGDHVVARALGQDRRGRREGRIVEVLEHANVSIVGRFHQEHGVSFVSPEDKRISQDIVIAKNEIGGAKPGQIVVAQILEQPSVRSQTIGRITEVLGNYADPGMEIEIALRKHHLPHLFPADVKKACARFSQEPEESDLKGRVDLRSLSFVTIDGETAKDFDDAVYCEREGEGYRLFVAIADVSHYVNSGDPLDREAALRGNSVYFPRRVVPMLPEILSNDLCSLNPEVDRLAMACEMNIDGKGKIVKYRFYPGVIRSHCRMTYTLVTRMLAESEGPDEFKSLLAEIQLLYSLYRTLVQSRELRGAIDFETIETEMIFDQQGKIERIVPRARNDAHRLIEECMLAANVCASDFLREQNHPALYRIHEGPTSEKLGRLRDFLKGFGLSLSGRKEPHARDYAKLLDEVKDRPDAQLLQTVMLRSLQQAIYSPDNVGHFGLAYESYTHFTSPIRRYPDLLIHRAIKAVLRGKKYAPGDWHDLGAHCSMTERRADEATRDVETWLKCYYMQDKIGESFEGTISGVAGFGIFVALDSVYVEGLVHISELGNDYFHHDEVKHQLLGERGGARFRLGDRIRVTLVRVDMESARIDFVLATGKRGR
ncbi:MAG TPA: ribonuclease R [Burkholderiales bacterium]|nr:ribonuclease R [Burkholderiales bacterium]